MTKNTYINGKVEKTGDHENELGDIWYQPDNKDGLFPSEKGRLLTWAVVKELYTDADGFPIDGEEWCDTEIEKIRTKWEGVETPMFGKQRDSILNLM